MLNCTDSKRAQFTNSAFTNCAYLVHSNMNYLVSIYGKKTTISAIVM
jgi:hypothetical protein